MTTKDEALKLALEALGWTDEWRPQGLKEKAITALREALNAPLAEQKSGIKQVIELYDSPEQLVPATELREQEPVATVAEVHMSRYTIEWTNGPLPEGTELYTSPPAQRKPLTDDKLADLWYKQSLDWMEFARAIEAAHCIKGDA